MLKELKQADSEMITKNMFHDEMKKTVTILISFETMGYNEEFYSFVQCFFCKPPPVLEDLPIIEDLPILEDPSEQKM